LGKNVDGGNVNMYTMNKVTFVSCTVFIYCMEFIDVLIVIAYKYSRPLMFVATCGICVREWEPTLLSLQVLGDSRIPQRACS